MAKKKSEFLSLIKSLSFVLLKNPLIVTPFIVLAIIDYAALTLIYLAPRAPFSKIMAPPIRRFWGEHFLHYPYNFSLIPKLFNYAHITISFTFGIFLSALFISLIAKKYNSDSEKVSFLDMVFTAIRKYIPMVIFFGVFYGLSQVLFKFTGMVVQKSAIEQSSVMGVQMVANFFWSFLLQVFFAFMFPILIIENVGLFRTFCMNFPAVFRNFKLVFFAVLIPSLLYAGIIVNMLLLPRMVQKYEPEVILVSLSINILLTVVIDLFITGFTSLLYMKIKNRKV